MWRRSEFLQSAMTEQELQWQERSVASSKLDQRYPRTGERLVDEGPGHFDVARHSDSRVGLQCFAEQFSRLFVITWGGAIH
jgi:hypothetical protein